MLLRPRDVLVDIGAWIGPTVLYAAAKGAQVHAFEPDPVAFKWLVASIAANQGFESRVTLYNAALSDSVGSIPLYTRSNSGDPKLGNSESSFFSDGRAPEATAQTLRADEMLSRNPLNSARLIKIDIEGAEYIVIPNIRPILESRKPTVYLSLHPFVWDTEKHPLLKKILAFAKIMDAFAAYPYFYLPTPTKLVRTDMENLLAHFHSTTAILFSTEKLD